MGQKSTLTRRNTILVVLGVLIIGSIWWYRAAQMRRWIRSISHQVSVESAVEAAEQLVKRKKMVKVFKKRTVQAKENAAEVLALLSTRPGVAKKAAENLVEMLSDIEIPVRQAAAAALGWMGKVAVDPLLEEGLTSPDQDVRRNSTQALITIGFPALPKLINALETGSAPVREGVAFALGELRSTRSIPALIGVLNAAEEDVRLSARDALVKIGRPAVRQLIDALAHESYLTRMNAAEALGEIADPVATDSLLARLKEDSNHLVRIYAAYALGKLGQRRVVPALLAVLKEDDKDLREAAAVSLGLLKDERAVEPLVLLLRDDAKGVREQAAEALGRIGQVTPSLLESLRSAMPGTREAAVLALGRIGEPRTVPQLVGLIKDPAVSVRRRVVWALGNTGPTGIEALILALQDPDWRVNYAARDSLARLGSPAVEALLRTFQSGNPLVARYAYEALAKMDPPPLSQLHAALRAEDKNVRLYAALSLGEIGTREALEPLQQLLSRERDEQVRLVAQRVLRKRGLLKESESG
ncbi:MAG TPA: HEAT repeat domain-containing protein [Armatimonadetes bacterium]|nr:HEAT repeat domain-containing protein [Armatimonadota bacterium]